MANASFLRRILAIDALSCTILGPAMGLGAGMLAPLFGLPEALVRGAGLALLPLALFIGWLASRAAPPVALVWLVIVGNLGWTVESFITIAQADAITPLGTAFVAAQALAVLGLAAMEYAGVRRSRIAA